jgi:hypothetical protein
MDVRETPIFGFLVLLAVVAAEGTLAAQVLQVRRVGREEVVVPPPAGVSPAPAETELAEQNPHPLERALQFARIRYNYLQGNVRDFTCLLVKREQLQGRLREYEFIRTKVRLQQVRDGRIVTPFSVYMHYVGPEQFKDRKVVYVEGQNEGKMLVRNGGKRFSYVTVRLTPTSEAALRESRYPITEMSLEKVAHRMIDKVEEDMRYDPAGANTAVTFFRNAKVEGRPCTRIQVVHPQRGEGLSFHLANVYVDDELHVPVRVEGYDWPAAGATEPPLLEEYSFTRLRLNVGLGNADFAPSLIEN